MRIPIALLTVTAAALGLAHTVLAGSTPAPNHRLPKAVKAPVPFQYAGDMEGVDKFYAEGDANKMIQRIHDSGLNAVRIYLHWNEEPLPHLRDTRAVCYAAHAAEQAGLKAVILDLVPTQGSWPLIPGDIQLFLDNIGSYDQGLLDLGSSCISHPSPLQIIWMIGNEPNVDTFCDGSDKGMNHLVGMLAEHTVCAQREALLLHSSYAYVQSEKQKYKGLLKANDLQVIGGGLSSNDAPFDFLAKYAQARKALGYTTCDMDYFGYHPYSESLANGPFFGLNQIPKVVAALKAMKCSVPIMVTEFGYNMYNMTLPLDQCLAATSSTAYEVPMNQYYQAMSAAVAKLLSLGVVGIFNMLMVDESRPGGWTSGWYDCHGDPKPFHDQIRQIFQNALSPAPRRGPPAP